MAHPEHVQLVREGSAAIDQWRAKVGVAGKPLDLRDADLRGIDLANAYLVETDFRGADLSLANLCAADLRGANFGPLPMERTDDDIISRNYPERTTSLTNARLNEAILAGAELVRADLRLVDFAQADLRGANLSGAILRAVNLVGAVYDGTTIWPQGFRPGLSVVKKLVVALDSEATKSTLSVLGRASFGKDHLLQQETELKDKYDTLSKRIAALDTDLGRALDSLTRQILDEQRREFAAQREEIAAQMARIEEQLGQ